MPHLKNKNKLLLDIAKGCERLPRADIQNIKVTFRAPSGEYDFSLPAALEAIANDLYWDDRGNWEFADLAIVETF